MDKVLRLFKAAGERFLSQPRLVRIGIVALTCSLVFLLFSFSIASSRANNGFYDKNAVHGHLPTKTAEEIQADTDRVVERGMFDISISSVIIFQNPNSPGEANIENVSSNNFDMSVDIRLATTDEVVYESGVIPPNSYIKDIELSRQLAPGKYSAVATFHAYKFDTHEEATMAAAQVTIVVGDF